MARRKFLNEILKRGGRYFDFEGGVFIPSKGKGNPNIGKVRRTVARPGDAADIWEFDAELIYKGNKVVGWKTTSTPKLLRHINYEGAESRLDRGFENMLTELGISGVTPDEIQRLRAEWSSLSDSKKSNVWEGYRKWLEDNHYGSFPRADSSSVDLVPDYVMEISKLIARESGKPIQATL